MEKNSLIVTVRLFLNAFLERGSSCRMVVGFITIYAISAYHH